MNQETSDWKLLRGITSVVVLALASMVTQGCASTSMSDFVSPDHDGRKFKTILVVVDSEDLGLRQQIESRACDSLAGCGARGLKSCEIFFPGREYQPEEYRSIMAERDIDAVLVLSRGESGFASQYVPESYHTTTSAYGSSTTNAYASSSATRTGNVVQGSAYGTSRTTGQVTAQSTTTKTGGYNVYKPWARFQVELIDLESGVVVWTAQGDSRGNGYNDQEDLWQSLADSTVKTIRKRSLLPR